MHAFKNWNSVHAINHHMHRGIAAAILPLLKKAVPIHTEPHPDDNHGVDCDGEENLVSGSLSNYNNSDEENLTFGCQPQGDARMRHHQKSECTLLLEQLC